MINIRLNFVCPICKGDLKKEETIFSCEQCHRIYKTENNIANFLPDGLDDVKKTETKTYSHRAKDFKEEEALKVGRKEFTDPLKKKGKDALFLELCGGAAHHALNLLKDSYKVVESDIAPGSVAKAKYFAEKLKIDGNGVFSVIDAENLPFKDQTFDGVFLIASLHHLPNPLKALREMQRVLKKGGVLLIGYEPNTWHYYLFYPFLKLFRYLIRRKSKHPISLADDQTFGFSKRKLKRLITESGMEVEKITPIDFWQVFYKKGLELGNKLFRKNWEVNERIIKILKTIDKFQFKLPLLDLMAFNYDVEAKKTEEIRSAKS